MGSHKEMPTYQLSQTKWVESKSNEGTVLLVPSLGEVVMNAVYRESTGQHVFNYVLPVEPVYVETVDGQERIVYKTSEMEMDRLYPVEWNGVKYALRKTEQSVEFFKFYPEENDH